MKTWVILLPLLAWSTLAASGQGADKLIVPDGSASSGGSLLLPLSVAGSSPVVAMQFDVRFSKSVVEVLSPLAAGESNHRAMSREMSDGWRRVVVFSRSNALLPKDVVIDLPMLMATGVSGQPSPMLRIDALRFSLADGTMVTPSIQRGPLDSWFAAHFSAADLEVPAIYGDASDPDGDGLANLLEYSMGGLPLFPDPGLLPFSDPEPGQEGAEFWGVTFWTSRTAEGVVVDPQLSSNLVDWTGVPALPTGAADDQSIEFSVTVDRTHETRQFIRLNVRRSQ